MKQDLVDAKLNVLMAQDLVGRRQTKLLEELKTSLVKVGQTIKALLVGVCDGDETKAARMYLGEKNTIGVQACIRQLMEVSLVFVDVCICVCVTLSLSLSRGCIRFIVCAAFN